MAKKQLTNAAKQALVTSGFDITGLSGSDIHSVQLLVSRAINNGWSPETLSQRLKLIIGLGPRNSTAVENYRAGLQQGVKIKTKGGIHTRRLNHFQIEARVNAYAERLKKQRRLLIAQYELRNTKAEAKRLEWQHEQTTGKISASAFRVVKVHKDERTCKICAPLNGKHLSISDPTGPPYHLNCRCTEVLQDNLLTSIK